MSNLPTITEGVARAIENPDELKPKFDSHTHGKFIPHSEMDDERIITKVLKKTIPMIDPKSAGVLYQGLSEAVWGSDLHKDLGTELLHGGVEFWSNSQCVTLEYNKKGNHMNPGYF